MEKKVYNLRVYKIILHDGKVMYESMRDGYPYASCYTSATRFSSVENLAMFSKTNVEDFHRDKEVWSAQFHIDFRPLHDIAITSGCYPRRCLPLTKEEAQEFWEHFSNS